MTYFDGYGNGYGYAERTVTYPSTTVVATGGYIQPAAICAPAPMYSTSTTVRPADARQAAEYHEKLAIQRAKEAERWEKRPKAPRAGKRGARVIWARKSFRGGEKKYDYAAVYAKGTRKWFLTGERAPRDGMTWDQLLEHLFHDTDDVEVWNAVTWEKLV